MSGFGSRGGDYGRSRGGGFGNDGGNSLEMFVPASGCGKIIGRGGSKIRELQDQTGCRIKVSRDDEGDGTRRVDLSGSDDAIQMAKEYIDQILKSGDDRPERVPRQSYQQQSYGGSTGGQKLVISIKSDYVGRIIGRGGSRIRELEEDSNCHINVSRDGGAYGQTDVEIIGSRQDIEIAKDLIEQITSQPY